MKYGYITAKYARDYFCRTWHGDKICFIKIYITDGGSYLCKVLNKPDGTPLTNRQKNYIGFKISEGEAFSRDHNGITGTGFTWVDRRGVKIIKTPASILSDYLTRTILKKSAISEIKEAAKDEELFRKLDLTPPYGIMCTIKKGTTGNGKHRSK